MIERKEISFWRWTRATDLGKKKIDRNIIDAIRQLEKNLGRGVFPWEVQPCLNYYRAEQTLRRDMARMAREGMLIRLGQRRGYLVAEKKGQVAA